jgi:transcriptional regulator with XRE-family HTH domain
MVDISAEQCRAARALLLWSQGELAARANVAKQTIQHFEIGKRQPYKRTLDDIVAALETGGVRFYPAVEGEHEGTVGLQWGIKSTKTGDTQGNATDQGDDTGALDALGWDDWPEAGDTESEDIGELDWTDEDRADQIEHWRSRPEAWGKLHEVSRQCLLRAMGVASLDQSVNP